MNVSEALTQLATIQQRLQQELPDRIRASFPPSQLKDLRAAMIIGPRGTGKTTLMLTRSKQEQLLYLSADNPIVSRFGIWELGNEALMMGYKGLAVDEVHYAKSWSGDLKALYDSFPKAMIYASDSSSIVLRLGVADLSRRFPKVRVPFLSFREYLTFINNQDFPILKYTSSSEKFSAIASEQKILPLFKEYITRGFRPFFLEGHYEDRLVNIIEKTIHSDIPFLLPSVQQNYLRLLNAIIGYLASSPIPTLNIESLSTEWSVGKEKLYELLSVLEHVELINIVRFKSDKKASGKGAKIFLSDPSMYFALSGKLGNVREAYVVCTAKQSGLEIFACKDEAKGDFILEDTIIEIGGRNKKRKQSDLVIRDDLDHPSPGVLPLWALGFGY